MKNKQKSKPHLVINGLDNRGASSPRGSWTENPGKKGFTLIELIVVIAVIGILVLLAAPKFLNYTEKARAAQIVNDIKVLETKIDEYLINHEAFPDAFTDGIPGDGQLYDRTGKIETKPENLKIVDRTFYPETKLDGKFYSDKDGEVVYEDNRESDGVVGSMPDVNKPFAAESADGNNNAIPLGEGTAANPYEIAYLEHLIYMNNEPASHFVLTRDLSFNEDESYLDAATNKGHWTTGTGWEPLGQFSGVLDGQNHGIYHLFIDRPSTWDVALFSYGYNVSVSNLLLIDTYVAGSSAGTLFGSLTYDAPGDFILTQIGIRGEVKGDNTIGGLAGYAEVRNSTSNLYAGKIKMEIAVAINTNTTSSINSIGGLFGYSESVGLDDVEANVNINIINQNVSAGSVASIGGISGYTGRSQADNVISYNNIKVSGDIRIDAKSGVNSIGGVAGYIDGNEESYLSGRMEKMENIDSSVDIELNVLNSSRRVNTIGGVAGYIYDINLKNINNSGDIKITATIDDFNSIGGVAGYIGKSRSSKRDISVSNLDSSGNININTTVDDGRFKDIGGVAGFFDLVDSINELKYAGNVNVVAPGIKKAEYVGGIAGEVFGGIFDWGLNTTVAHIDSVDNLTVSGIIEAEGVIGIGGVFGRIDSSTAAVINRDGMNYTGPLNLIEVE